MSRTIHGKSHEALKAFRPTPAALAVYWIYVSRMNNEGVTWPSLPKLAKDTGWNKNTCHEARNFLVRVGALELVKDYVRPNWRNLPAQDRTRRLNFDKSEYYRPTGHIMLDGKQVPLLYNGADEASALEEESSDVPSGRTSATGGHPVPADVQSGGTVLDSLSVLGSSKSIVADATAGDPPQEKKKRVRQPKPAPKPRSEVNHEPVYEAVERLIFGIADAEPTDPYLWESPTGYISLWLMARIGKFQKKDVGYIKRAAEPEHVERFVEWYGRKYKDASLPHDVNKFITHWREFASEMNIKKMQAAAAPVIRPPEPTAEELAEGRRLFKEAREARRVTP